MTPILKLKKHNRKKEIEFELKYLQSLSIQERFKMCFQKTKEMLDLLEKSGHRRPSQIIKRAAGRPQDLEDLQYLRRLKKAKK